jgi:aspartate kinase
MVENLNVSNFRNGEAIPEAKTNEEWIKAGNEGKPAWCYYENRSENGRIYGKLYNWYALNDPRGLAPAGWSIPENNDWRTLVKNLKGVAVVTGFIASTFKNETTTLGRGGSDYTAAIFGAALKSSKIEIWTDVTGVMTADPRKVKKAFTIPSMTYIEAMEMSHFGAKVIYPPTIQPVMSKNIPVWIKNTFAPEDHGTLIENDVHKNGNNIRGISSINKIALLSLEGSGMVGIPGFSRRLFESLANDFINVILITQGSSEHSICVGIDEALADKAKLAVDKT